MRRAIADNHDLAAAKATLAQAQELVAAQAGQLLSAGWSARRGTGRQKYGSEFLGDCLPSVPPFTYDAVGASVHYTLDYDGAIARSIEQQQALAQYQRSELGCRAFDADRET